MATNQTEPSTKELVQALSEQTSALVRKELALAQLELKEKGKRAGIGGGLFGGAGLLSLYGLAAVVAAGILALDQVVPGWAAALIVAAILFAVAGGMALVGRTEVKRATPPKPEAAAESVGEDVRYVREHAEEGRHRG